MSVYPADKLNTVLSGTQHLSAQDSDLRLFAATLGWWGASVQNGGCAVIMVCDG